MGFMNRDLTNLTVSPHKSIREAIALMELSKLGIVLVIDKDQRLMGTITDGDLRRSALAGGLITDLVKSILEQKTGSLFAKPIVASAGTDSVELLKILEERSILHLPIVDEYDRVVDLVTMGDLINQQNEPIQAVIMAGGMGMRLRPLTDDLPKPMLPVGNRPLLEIIVNQLKESDIQNINVSVYHESNKIKDYFGDGKDFGVEITYSSESQPLGTAGALGLMSVPDRTTLVINGDILSAVDLRAMFDYHREHKADLTIAVSQQDFQVPYGIIQCEGSYVTSLSEKPLLHYFINAGIYLLEPSVYALIPEGEKYDMTDLINSMLESDLAVAAFPVREYWIDIGEPEAYEKANEDMSEGRINI